MKRIRLTDPGHPDFARAWRLYKESFPVDERRRLNSHRRIMLRSIYHFDVVMDHNVFIGILLWWDFESVRYIEHLAVVPTLRGMQHGERILRRFLSESDMPVWLEVEPPDNELDYTQPAYEKSRQPVPLLVMTYPEAITEPDIRFFCRQYHPLLTDYSLAGA